MVGFFVWLFGCCLPIDCWLLVVVWCVLSFFNCCCLLWVTSGVWSFSILVYPEPRTMILQLPIISTVVIVTTMLLLYLMLSLLAVTSIIISFHCICYCGLTTLKFVWSYYCIVGQLILLMYSKKYDNFIIWGEKISLVIVSFLPRHHSFLSLSLKLIRHETMELTGRRGINVLENCKIWIPD